MPKQARKTPWLDTLGEVYYAFWYDPKQKRTQRCSLRTKDHIEAARRFATFLADGQPLYAGVIDKARLTVGKALDDYLEEHVRVKVADQERIVIIARYLMAFFDTTPVADIDIPLCRAYCEARRDGTLTARSITGALRVPGPGTLRRELGTLVAAINHAAAWRRIPRDAVPTIELPERPPSKELWFTQNEMTRLFEAAPLETRAGQFIRLAYYTAGRRRSIETLTKFQVSLDRGLINLSKPNETRTKKRRPIVPIDPKLMETIEYCMTESKTSYVLGNDGSIRTAFGTALRNAGLETLPDIDGRRAGKPTPHTLRHSRATHLLQAGKSPWSVASLLGDSVQTVLNTYGHHCPDYLREALSDGQEMLK